MKSGARFSDLQRALQISRDALVQQLGDRDREPLPDGKHRWWKRGEVATMALERALINAGLAVAAARMLAADILPDDPFDEVTVPKSWLVIAAQPDRWLYAMVRDLTWLKTGVNFPVLLLHPRTIIAAALARLDKSAHSEIVAGEPVTRRPAMPGRMRGGRIIAAGPRAGAN